MIQIININNILKFTVLSVPLFINRNVHEFRVNQEMLLKLFTIIALALWLIEIINNQEKIGIIWASVTKPLFLLMALMTLSLLRSQFFAVSWQDYVIFMAYFILFFLVIYAVNSTRQFNSFIKLFFFTSFIVALFALLHYYGLDPYLYEIKRLISTIGQKNWTSNYLAMVFPVVFSYFLLTNDSRKWLYFVLLTILYTVLIIFQSRGVWISAGLTLLIALYLIFKFRLLSIFKKNKKWITLLVFTFLVITVIYSIPNPLNKNVETMPQKVTTIYEDNFASINSRLLMWETAIEMIKDNPLLGKGVGLFEMNYLDYQSEVIARRPIYQPYHSRAEETHNEYLQLATELGIIGLGIFLYVLFIFYRSALGFLKKKEEQKSEREKIILWGLLMGMTCFLFNCFFTFPFHVPALGSAFSIIVALAWVYVHRFKVYNYHSNHLKASITKKDGRKNQGRKKLSKNTFQNVLRYTVIGAILILMIAGIYSIALKPYRANQLYFKGIAFYQVEKYPETVSFFEQAVRLDPYNGRILYALGTSYLQTNQPDKAREILERAQNYIQEIYLYRNLSLTYQQLGDKQSAQQALLRVIKLDSQSLADKLNLSELYAADDDYEKAIDYLLQVLEDEPDYPGKKDIYYKLGLMHQKNNEPYKAHFYFQQIQEK